MPLLHAGDRFPALTFNLHGWNAVSLPDAFAGSFGVVLFSRGAWCITTVRS